jgi:hypothetical protein
VLLRPLYLALTSAFSLIRLISMTDSDKNVEILTLRHQLAILQRQTDGAVALWDRRTRLTWAWLEVRWPGRVR